MPAKYGSFWIKNVIGNRCMGPTGTSTQQKANGATLVVSDCVSTYSSQQYRIEAEALQ